MELQWSNNSPDAGVGCDCSVCGEDILDFAIRFFKDDNTELRMHEACWNSHYNLFGPDVINNDILNG